MSRAPGRRTRLTLVATLAGLALRGAGEVPASSFTVTPVQVELSASNRSALLTLANESAEELRFQISAFAWHQGPRGEIRLSPTEDIVFFPALLALGPGRERKIRIGSTVPAGDAEKTYRIFVEELPPAGMSRASNAGTQVRVLTRMGVPIFVQPARPEASGTIEVAGLESGRLRFRVHNSGNVHFLLRDVRVRCLGASDEPVLDRSQEGWYVLAGGVRDYEETLPPEACSKVRTLVLEARTDGGRFETRQAAPPGGCDSPAPSDPERRSE